MPGSSIATACSRLQSPLNYYFATHRLKFTNSPSTRAAERTGLKGINPKSLRPFAATQAKKAGYTLEDLQEGLGHTSISTTEGYVRKHEISRSKVRLTLPKKT